jgi:tetratricopeptide (TPR) repeat protein
MVAGEYKTKTPLAPMTNPRHNFPMRPFLLAGLLLLSSFVVAQHDHPVPEKLGMVNFPTSCSPAVQARFTRAVALLHSFAYEESSKEFQSVVADDAKCAIAHWGVAMTYFHPLWDVLDPAREKKGKSEMAAAVAVGTKSAREADLIAALAAFYSNPNHQSLRDRMLTYEHDMEQVAARYPDDTEAQIFYALALLSTAPPTDRTHTNQKKAVAILEPLYAKYPQHPGLAHYLIHASDNSEMATSAIKVAKEYSQIAPSAPHALHMPSHIFTRTGMWNDSVQSNLAARKAAREHHDIGEELHAMDYLTYAYLQLGDYDHAAAVLKDLSALTSLNYQGFKIGYADTAMPVRYAVERKNWKEASEIKLVDGAPPEVTAISAWSRATGLARSGNATSAKAEAQRLVEIEKKLRSSGNVYWADQVAIQLTEANGWIAQASGDPQAARRFLAEASDQEDSMEKLPLTPGPIVPAREQFGELLLLLQQPADALSQFERALQESPGRRNALLSAQQAAKQAGMPEKAAKFEIAVKQLAGQ